VNALVHRLLYRHVVTYTDLHDARLIFCWPRRLVPGKTRAFFQEAGKKVVEIDGDNWYERMHRE
jgi:hypothetical protein